MGRQPITILHLQIMVFIQVICVYRYVLNISYHCLEMAGEIHRIDVDAGPDQSINTPSLHTPNPHVPDLPPSSTLPTTIATPIVNCETRIDLNYDVTPTVICALCVVFGVLYCFLGKHLKIEAFLQKCTLFQRPHNCDKMGAFLVFIIHSLLLKHSPVKKCCF